jgi:hypothetical protein
MEMFTFEIIWPGGGRVVAGSISLPGHEGLWCHVETLTLRSKALVGAVIRVKDSNGGIIIRAGVVTVRASVTLVTVHLPWVRQVPGGSLAVRLSGHTRRFL